MFDCPERIKRCLPVSVAPAPLGCVRAKDSTSTIVNKSSGFIDPRKAQLICLLIAMSFFDGMAKENFQKKGAGTPFVYQ
jgi:hypothetical protein